MILKQKFNYSWNRKHKCNVMFVMLVIVGCIWRKPVSTYAISVLIGGCGEFGEYQHKKLCILLKPTVLPRPGSAMLPEDSHH